MVSIFRKHQEKYDNETKKRSLDGSKAMNTYTQSVEYIKPLTEMLKKRVSLSLY